MKIWLIDNVSMGQNSFVSAFCDTINKRYNRDAIGMTNGEWMCKNTSLNKRPFTFQRYPFQEAIANDMHPNLDCIKPSQVGLTEIQIRKALTILKRNDNLSLIYTMPNEQMFKRISKARIQPIMDFDRAFADPDSKSRNSMGLMRVGSSFMYVTGSGEGDATSINADIVFNDEIDLTPQDMLSLFNSRLQGSDMRINQRFSTPTYEGFGVDKGYKASDQFEYIVKCPHCNHHQIPDFNLDFVRVPKMPDVESLMDLDESMLDDGLLDLNGIEVCCEKCHRPLDLGDYERREWVPRFPSRTHARGYRIRPFSSHRLDPMYCLTQLFAYKRRDNLKGFYNTVLGQPYVSGESKLTDSHIDNVLKNPDRIPPIASRRHWLGVDVGLTCHVVVGAGNTLDDMAILWMLTCDNSELGLLLGKIFEMYPIEQGLADRYPYTPTVNKIRDGLNGKVMPAVYGGNLDVKEVKNQLGAIDYVNINRTQVLDHVFNGVRHGNWDINGYGNQSSIVKEQLKDMVREEGDGEGEAKWVKLNGQDHFFHALAYMAGAMLYKGVADSKQDYEHLTYGVVGAFSSVNLAAPASNFGVDDLIGYAGNTGASGSVIKRHSY